MIKRRVLKWGIITLTSVSLMGCASSTSKYFDCNQYVEDAYNYIINDSLKFLHKTYGDVQFTRIKDTLIDNIPKGLRPLKNILAHGSTEVPPFYDYYLLLDSKKRIKHPNNQWIFKDTLIAGHSLTFIGIPKDKDERLKDFETISSNLYMGDSYRSQFVSLFELMGNCFSHSNRYLECLLKVNSYPATSVADRSFKEQMQLTFASFLGENYMYDSLMDRRKSDPDPTIQKIIETEAVHGLNETLVELKSICRNEKLVMFNENHFYPSHRIFVTEFLPHAKSLGFSYLALEALSPDKEIELNKDKPLNIEDGFYTREQNFVKLITLAQDMGFTLISYDKINSTDRESVQAKNIYEKTFSRDSTAKVLVLAGIAHIHETTIKGEKKWMAQIFKENYHVDPLTISQTALKEYRNTSNEVAIIESSAVEGKKRISTDYALINNLDVFNKNTNFEYENKYSKPVQVSIFEIDSIPYKIYPNRRLPIKSFLLNKNETYRTKLSLKNKYQYFVLDSLGKVLEHGIAFSNSH